MSGSASEAVQDLNKVFITAAIHDGPKAVKAMQRPLNASPQASFNYGDGTYLMKFTYKKDAKANERGGQQVANAAPQDGKKQADGKQKVPDKGDESPNTNSGSNAEDTLASNYTRSVGKVDNTRHNDDKKSSADRNKLKNASASANAGKETATMTLRGYPLLKAKATVEITGVGKGSGVWYCKTVVQEWHVDHGYITNAKMTKGGGGGGGKDGGGSGGNSVSAPPKS